MQLADASNATYFLQVFGQPRGDTACECERSTDANLAQSLHLLNGREIQDKIARDNARTARLATDANRSRKTAFAKSTAGSSPANPPPMNSKSQSATLNDTLTTPAAVSKTSSGRSSTPRNSSLTH
ncbi:MAG UNVERIFIED_CONTAM: hypothetical protein LVR18_36925 [Planctomycetaceae bacterium]